jgi:AbrB family looped-hinge helix DNA binding protein
MSHVSTLTSKGQTTIPKEIREALGLRQGDQIEFTLESDGVVRLQPIVKDIRALRGCLARYVQAPVTVEAMKEAVKKRFTKGARP